MQENVYMARNKFIENVFVPENRWINPQRKLCKHLIKWKKSLA